MDLLKKPLARPTALDLLNKKILENPHDKNLYAQRAKLYIDQQQFYQAVHDFNMVLHIAPMCSETRMALAAVYRVIGQIDSAFFECLFAFYLQPEQAAVRHSFLGTLFLDRNQKKSALIAFENAFALDPNDTNILINLSAAYYNNGLTDKCLEMSGQLLTIDPQSGAAYFNLANCLSKKGLFKEADSAYQKAIELLPKAPTLKALFYQGLAAHYDNQNNLTDAIHNIDKAITFDPNLSSAHLNRAIFLLRMGKCNRAWQSFEKRLHLQQSWAPLRDKRMWQGEDLNNRRLLVCCDEGHGDAFQMARYLPLLKKQGATIIIAAASSLNAFFKTLPQLGVSEWVAENTIPGKFDYWISIVSLPYRFQTELNTIPSLKPAWQFIPTSKQQLPKTNRHFRVGLVWAGNPEHLNNENRSMSLSLFEPLFSCPQISFYSLQRDEHSCDIQMLGWENRIIDLGPKIKGWEDTAKFLSELDLLITVDTAIAHLSGSLGRLTWVMLPFASDWRWLLDRNDSPWYPSVRLFRQKHPCDWSSVITAIKTELLAFV